MNGLDLSRVFVAPPVGACISGAAVGGITRALDGRGHGGVAWSRRFGAQRWVVGIEDRAGVQVARPGVVGRSSGAVGAGDEPVGAATRGEFEVAHDADPCARIYFLPATGPVASRRSDAEGVGRYAQGCCLRGTLAGVGVGAGTRVGRDMGWSGGCWSAVFVHKVQPRIAGGGRTRGPSDMGQRGPERALRLRLPPSTVSGPLMGKDEASIVPGEMGLPPCP